MSEEARTARNKVAVNPLRKASFASHGIERNKARLRANSEKNSFQRQKYEKLQQARLGGAKTEIRNRVDNFMQKPNHPGEKEDIRLTAAKSIYQSRGKSKSKMAINATKLGIQLRREMKEGGGSSLQVAFALALLADFGGFVPIAGSFLAFFAGIALFFALWGTGKWKMKLLRIVLYLCNVIPGVGVIPLALLSVAHAAHVWKERREKAKLKYKKLQLKMKTAGIGQAH